MKPTKATRKFGWVPDRPDIRDHSFAARPRTLKALPAKVDLTPHCPPVYDQGQLGSCTANAIAAAIEFDRMRQNLQDFTPSRLFIYYNERAMEGSVATDSGAADRKSTRLNSSHIQKSRMPSSA